MQINFNSDAPLLGGLRNFQTQAKNQNTALERLATGSKINRGADDPAGMITSEQLRSMLRALEAESRTLQRTDHVIAVADGALGEISNMVIEAQGLALANAGGGLSDAEIEANNMELASLRGSINRLAGSVAFNGDTLFDGSLSLSAGGSTLAVSSLSIPQFEGTSDGIMALRQFGQEVATLRGELGAFSRYQVGSQQSALAVRAENISAANSNIRDTDYAQEASNLIRSEILGKASLSALKVLMSNREQIINILG